MNNFGIQKINDVPEEYKKIRVFSRNMIVGGRHFEEFIKNPDEFYILTGRGPSKDMHLGHLIPFQTALDFQRMFKIPVLIQISDDEKFYRDSLYGKVDDNLESILKMGFDKELTTIFVNSRDMNSDVYKTASFIAKHTTINSIKHTFGIDDTKCLGQLMYFAIQGSLALGLNGKRCLVISGLDQDPFFRLLRSISLKDTKMSYPVTLYTSYLPSLDGSGKMSSSSNNSNVIYLNDTNKDIKTKIYKSFSGGGLTLQMHQQNGGNTDIDVSYQLLRFFYNDDLEPIKQDYESGKMSSKELKDLCFKSIIEYLQI